MGRPWSAGPIFRTVAIVPPPLDTSDRHHAQLARQWEVDVFLADGTALDRRPVAPPQVLDALLHHLLRGAGAGSDQDRLAPAKPGVVDLAHAVDQVGRFAARLGQLGQALA